MTKYYTIVNYGRVDAPDNSNIYTWKEVIQLLTNMYEPHEEFLIRFVGERF